jgi:hypothetical protein
MKNLIVRCSSLSKMMTNPRGKTEELSATTKTWLKEMVKEEVFKYRKQLDTPAINKGIDFENLSIDLLNDATFNKYIKNEERKNNGWLDWQLRGYMMLWNKPKASIRYCMISTPDSLLKDWDNKKIHKVDHIDPASRISTVSIERDEALEEKMLERYEVANKYYKQYLNELLNK